MKKGPGGVPAEAVVKIEATAPAPKLNAFLPHFGSAGGVAFTGGGALIDRLGDTGTSTVGWAGVAVLVNALRSKSACSTLSNATW